MWKPTLFASEAVVQFNNAALFFDIAEKRTNSTGRIVASDFVA